MAIRVAANPPGHVTEGEKADPPDNTLMADTGELTAGRIEVRVTIGASANAEFDLQHRNATNAANTGAVQHLRGAGTQSSEFVYTYSVAASERIRVVMGADLTGTAEASLQWEYLE